ncbi:MAG: DUF4332 domain-containing protein [Verrucomicrobiales bacterium]|nr:DUF4332 domain-containing protein [Verrucomicrobiales bacterium]
MPALTDIQELSRNAQKLLKAAGIDSATKLAEADITELLSALGSANKKIRLYKRIPSRETIEGWINAAHLTAHAPTASQQPSNIPLSKEEFEQAAENAAEATGLFDVNGRPIHLDPDNPAAAARSRRPLDYSRMQTFGDVGSEPTPETASTTAPPPDKPTPAPSPSTSTFEQRKLQRIDSGDKKQIPRSVRRGIEHPNPVRVYTAMVIVLISRVLFYVVVIGTPVIIGLKATEVGDFVMAFVPVWIAFVVFGIAHLIAASRVRCRVCSCHLLFSRRCHKHIKAHKLFPLGWAGSTALHAILFRWFRCMYCGTPTQFGTDKNRPG